LKYGCYILSSSTNLQYSCLSRIACIVHTFLMFLVTLSKLNDGSNDDDDDMQGFCTVHDDRSCWIINQIKITSKDNMIFKEIVNMLSIISSWVLVFMPSKVSIQSAPGYTFASTWVFYPIKDKFGFIPNLPVRICETTMGRLSLREIAIIFPIHFLVPTAAYWVLQTITSSAIEPIVYSEKYVVDALLREVVVNALFTVGLLVIPELKVCVCIILSCEFNSI